MLNRVILIGRLTKDPELKYTPSGVAVTTFTLAVDRPFKNQSGEKETDFIKCQCWRRCAETVAQYVTKGRLVAVDGRMQVRSYDDQNGNRRWVTEVVADTVRFLEKAHGNSETSSHQQQEEDYGFDQDNDLPF